MNKIVGNVVGIASFVLAYALSSYIGWVALLFVAPVVIGIWFPSWYFKKKNSNKGLIKWLAWSNLVSWLVPLLGLLTSISTFSSQPFTEIESKGKFKILAMIGILLSIGNAAIGILLNLNV